MATNNTKNRIYRVSIVCIAILVAIGIVLGAASSKRMLNVGSLHAILMLSFGMMLGFVFALWIIHFGFAILSSSRRTNVLMLCLMPTIVMIVVAQTRKWENYGHRRWFLEKALPEYQKSVGEILGSPILLKNLAMLDVSVDHPPGCSHVNGEMKADGSVMIIFSGLDHWREGYCYYAGSNLQFERSRFLTNCWYEYYN